MVDEAWEKQSASLVEVQKKGTGLETTIQKILGWNKGKVIYDIVRKYKIQVDAAFPSLDSPKVIASVTYTDPDKRGHSNENKFQLKVGELILLKSAYPDIRVALVLGGVGEAWLSYVLSAFQIFFDEVIYLWNEDGRDRIKEIANDPYSIPMKHSTFWNSVRSERSNRKLLPEGTKPPCSRVRYDIMDFLKSQPIVFNPSLINNEIAKLCMRRSYDMEGAEWSNYLKSNWGKIEMSRNYFNPVEAVVEIALTNANLKFTGGIARDVGVPSLLHDLDMPETSVSEDFVLFSKRLQQPVFIQCKASGGGRRQHGKNIQNRTKEQTTRSILYSCSSPDKKTLMWKKKEFHWISILDGDWGVTKAEPLKYIHMLQMAGYDKIICVADMLTADLTIRRSDNPLLEYLINVLDCESKN